MNARVDPFSPEELAKVSQRPGEIKFVPDKELATALARAQGAFGAITRDKTVTVRTKAGGTYSFSYAPLEAILRAVQPALAKEGLALTQAVVGDQGEYLETTLHLGGETLSNRVKLLVGDPGPQAYGSALTYARRYGVTLLLCVCADDDDDGNTAEGNAVTATESRAVANHPKAKDYAKRFHEAFEVGIDQAVVDIHAELRSDEELYRATWGMLPSAMRRQIKELVDRAKQP